MEKQVRHANGISYEGIQPVWSTVRCPWCGLYGRSNWDGFDDPDWCPKYTYFQCQACLCVFDEFAMVEQGTWKDCIPLYMQVAQ